MLFTSKVVVVVVIPIVLAAAAVVVAILVVVVRRDAAFVGFRLQFPLFQSNSYFPRGLLACDDNGNGARHGRETSRRIERANG